MEGGREGALLLLQRLQGRCEGMRERVRKATRTKRRRGEEREGGKEGEEGREGGKTVTMETLLKQGEGHDGLGKKDLPPALPPSLPHPLTPFFSFHPPSLPPSLSPFFQGLFPL